ncbi:MAG: hypothetical protein WAW39_23930 [Prosthecobacter sp.]|uniref:hypothetical protein n=1 Tax=Prosthecobacter sp. TaxID=1965333 RepID=UPI003BB0D246
MDWIPHNLETNVCYNLAFNSTPKQETKSSPNAALVYISFMLQPSVRDLLAEYGFFMFVGHFLEQELRQTVDVLAAAKDPKKFQHSQRHVISEANFHELISRLETDINISHGDGRKFISHLHKARKLRNKFAHAFLFLTDNAFYPFSEGGRNKLRDDLASGRNFLIGLVLVLNDIKLRFWRDAAYDQIISKIFPAEEQIRNMQNFFRTLNENEDAQDGDSSI